MSKYDSPRRIYAACLASYNAGKLHGEWIDCDNKTAEELQEEINAMLASSPEPGAEEWAIHDHEGFGDLISEYTNLETVALHAEMLEKHGPAWGAFCENTDADLATEENFLEAFCGVYRSKIDYATELLEDIGELKEDSIAARYFDYYAFARDLFITDYWYDEETGAVFRNY